MRVIAGKYRSRPLLSARGLDLRPTSDRLRETLFDVLTAGNPSALEGTVWVDLFAGTGAVGIEALSRGADKVFFVECSARAAELVRRNLESLGIAKGFEVLKQEAARALGSLDAREVAADFIFLDPPYRMERTYGETLRVLAESDVAVPGTVVIAEHPKKFDPGEEFGGLRRYRRLQQGDAALSFYGKAQ
jgi:16S rRNA (guanine966-N2)-methyltransferase